KTHPDEDRPDVTHPPLLEGTDPNVAHHEGGLKHPQQKQAHYGDQDAPQHPDRILIFLKEPSQPADRKAQGVKDHGKTEDEKQRMDHGRPANLRSEEHTSELQSRENLVCRLLLEKKNNAK